MGVGGRVCVVGVGGLTRAAAAPLHLIVVEGAALEAHGPYAHDADGTAVAACEGMGPMHRVSVLGRSSLRTNAGSAAVMLRPVR